jgi:hypothetical protein
MQSEKCNCNYCNADFRFVDPNALEESRPDTLSWFSGHKWDGGCHPRHMASIQEMHPSLSPDEIASMLKTHNGIIEHAFPIARFE